MRVAVFSTPPHPKLTQKSSLPPKLPRLQDGVRVPHDLGSSPDWDPGTTTAPRVMVFGLDERDYRRTRPVLADLSSVFETPAQTVVMCKGAAGSRRVGNAFHGRKGKGFTLSLDLARPTRNKKAFGKKKGKGKAVHATALYKFWTVGLGASARRFVARNSSKHSAMDKALERAKVAEGAGGVKPNRRHCWYCATDLEDVEEKRYQYGGWSMDKGRCFCGPCMKFRQASPASRPAAKLCAGCSGCRKL